ncbi:large conductance mechanosensitive channel protein MscL [Chloroflexia bacterium SDU3-3]|nr:large conductance mechanosensitive channel protein MscL [Chloroflexia bacterium SDU3-3]
MAEFPAGLGGPVNLVKNAGKELGGFRKFLLRGNVVDLAVGVVIGAAFSDVINAIVKGLLTPLIGLFGGGPNLSSWVVGVGSQQFLVGEVLNALIAFILMAAVIYFLIVLPVNKLMDRYQPAPKPAPVKECPECLSSIPEAARRCRDCGAQLIQPPTTPA